MRGSLQRIVLGALFFSVTIIAAIIGYRIAGWSLVDACYMVVITVFGVGYGEVHPITTPALKVFTMVVIIAGTSSAVYIVGGFVQLITEGEIHKALDARRMTREIASLRHHVIICGFGRIGQILARKLTQVNQPFVIIDLNSERVADVEEQGYLVLHGNATDERVLQAAGITQAKALATVLPDDAINVFITLTARELNPKMLILARGELPSTEKKLRLAGANQVVLPAAIGAERIAQMITHPAALDFLQQEEGRMNLNEILSQLDVQLEEFAISGGSPFEKKTLSEIEIRGKGAFIVVAVQRFDGTLIIHPNHELLLELGDTVIVMGHRGDIPKFAQRYAVKRAMRYRGSTRSQSP